MWVQPNDPAKGWSFVVRTALAGTVVFAIYSGRTADLAWALVAAVIIEEAGAWL